MTKRMKPLPLLGMRIAPMPPTSTEVAGVFLLEEVPGGSGDQIVRRQGGSGTRYYMNRFIHSWELHQLEPGNRKGALIQRTATRKKLLEYVK